MLICLLAGVLMLLCIGQVGVAQARTSRARRAWHAVKRRVRRPLNWTRAQMTRLGDSLEAKLPERLKPLLHAVRNMSPFTLGKFAHAKFKQDGAFLASYGVASSVVGYASLPVLLGTISPIGVVAVRVAHNLVDAGVLLWRQHQLRADRSQTVRGTLRQLGAELDGYGERQRVLNRRYLRRLAGRKQSNVKKRRQRRYQQSPGFSAGFIAPLLAQ